MKAVDLHVHSNRSDGTFTPTQLVDYALEKGLSAFALTDHDTVDGLAEAIAYADRLRQENPLVPEVIPGIELSTEYHGKDIHIVGLYIDYTSEKFTDTLKEFVESRDNRNRKMCKLLEEHGIDITYEKLIEEFPDCVLTRAHYARYMLNHGYINSMTEAFEKYIGDRCDCYVPREKITPQDGIAMILEAGDYILRVGNSSRNTTPCSVAELTETVIVSKHQNLCSSAEKWQKLHRNSVLEIVDVKRIIIGSAVFQTEVMDYAEVVPEEDVKVTDILKKLSVEDQIKFCAGIGLLGGKTGFTLPGSVGNTTSDFWKLGIPNATFCDGPAGIRIQRRSTVDKKGGVKPVDGAMAIYEYLPVFLQKFLFGNPAKETMIYQYVTSFPVAAAMAQTWNLQLTEEVGKAVSREMTEYGVVFWLAPALNIIRNPLCGRNYEYYSEDPLISGKMAAAVTRGVQATPGNYVTIKHFAANNQEENRYYVSSDMDERTLREIYLRGFEIVVKEANPKALMTAYNKINGVYCPASTDLIDMILRREWGFDGVVMTDWLSTGEDRAQNADCIANGMDLIMPGGSGVWKELSKAHKAGRLSADSIRRAAYNVLNLVLNSQIKVV